jgi:hypothetical protein
MSRPQSPLESRPRMTRFRSVLAATIAALLVFVPTSLARAENSAPTEGSVPSEVTAYVADGSLVAQLNDVYGVNAEGDGIDFDETTKPGVIERVHVWSAELRDGEETDHPLDLVNEWIVPISVADSPVGLATIWINPATVRPELALFQADAELATALSAVADGSSLVHDVESAAWLALAADGTLTPLVPGTTGLSTPVPLDDVALLPSSGGAGTSGGDPGTGVGFAIAVVLLLLIVIIVALVFPGLRAKKTPDAADADADAEADAETDTGTDADAEPTAQLEAAPVSEEVETPSAELEATPKKPTAR